MYKFFGLLGGFIIGIFLSTFYFSFHDYRFGADSLVSSVMVFFIPESETPTVWLFTIPLLIIGFYLGYRADKKVVKF